jgi:hypothetical protein
MGSFCLGLVPECGLVARPNVSWLLSIESEVDQMIGGELELLQLLFSSLFQKHRFGVVNHGL